MKRLLCFILVVIMLCSVVIPAVPAFAATVTVYDNYTLISKGKSYKNSAVYTKDASASVAYRLVDGKELTDGKIPTDTLGTDWIGFHPATEKPMYATIDLGSKQSSLGQFRVYLTVSPHSGIGKPGICDYYVSDNGTDFKKVGSGTYETPSNPNSWCTLKLDTPVSGRYVKVDFGSTAEGALVFCGEFEVYSASGRQVDASTLPGMTLRSDSFLKEDGACLLNAHLGNTVEYLIQCIRDNASVAAYSAKGTKLSNKSTMKTGDYFAKLYNGVEIDRTYVVMEGDCDGDGKITIADYILNNRINAGKANVSEPYKKAKTAKINIKNHVLGIKDMYASKTHNKLTGDIDTSKPGGANVPYPDVTTPSTYAKHTMSFKKNNDSLYTMSTTASDGKALTWTFYRTAWGTFNIGALTVGGTRLAGGATDWEYVFVAKGELNDGTKDSDGSVNDSRVGGNHGQERMVSLKIYNGVTGEEIKLSNGQTASNLTQIKIVENTVIHLGERVENSDFLKVTRTYNWYGETITLDCDFEFIKDQDLGLSYTCMFPVTKAVGLYCMFKHTDGTSFIVETSEVGKADYSGPSYKNHKALECILWGKKNTDYAFAVKVNTQADSVDNFKNNSKTFYWDMNTTENKLYFSRCPDSGYQTIKAGTKWHTQSVWTLFCLN